LTAARFVRKPESLSCKSSDSKQPNKNSEGNGSAVTGSAALAAATKPTEPAAKVVEPAVAIEPAAVAVDVAKYADLIAGKALAISSDGKTFASLSAAATVGESQELGFALRFDDGKFRKDDEDLPAALASMSVSCVYVQAREVDALNEASRVKHKAFFEGCLPKIDKALAGYSMVKADAKNSDVSFLNNTLKVKIAGKAVTRKIDNGGVVTYQVGNTFTLKDQKKLAVAMTYQGDEVFGSTLEWFDL
jgi:hypothetical protein